MRIIFIRHAQTILEKDVPNPLWQLSPQGIESAKKIADISYLNEVDVFYSSLQTKALQTALILAKDNHIPIKTHSDLTELTSITNKFIIDFDHALKDLYAGKVDRLNDGETIEEGKKRFNKAVASVVESEIEASTIAIVAHGNILSIFAAQYVSHSAYDIHKKIKMPDLAIFDWEQKKFLSFYGEVL